MSLNRVIKRLKIEMSGSTKQYQVSAKQHDRATRYVEIQLLNQGAEYEIPPGSNVTAYIKKPDLKRAYSPCTFSGSVVTMELTSQTLAAAGTALAEIEVKSGDMTEVITSCTFEIEIEPCVKDEDAIISGDEMSLFDATMKAYAEAEAARVTAENARKTAENARKTAENARVSAETGRANAENARVTAENARVEAENARVSAETGRANAENARVTAENARVTAENTRQENATIVLNKANEAVEIASQINEASYIYDSDNDVKYAYAIYAQRGVPHMSLTKITA